MEKPAVFIAGMAVGFVGVYVVAKALRPTIKERLSDLAARKIIQAVQSEGIPPSIIPPYAVLRRNLIDPAVDDGLKAVWL